MITVGSLFSGIGGFDLAFERAGCEIKWMVEIDTAARSVLTRHWPDVPKFADVRDVGGYNLEPVDVITFGSPCQDLSVAGKRAGMVGERSGLFYEAVRIIRELRPAIALWENVPGALSSAQGRDFGAAIDALADAGALDICWRVLDAQWFGVAQRRRRVFVIADFRGERASEILFESEGVSGHPTPSREARQDVAGTLGGSSQSGGFRTTDLDNNGAFVPLARSQTTREGSRLDGESCTFVTHALTAEGFDASEDGTGRGTPLVPIGTFQNTGHGWWNQGDVATTIRTPEGSGSLEANVVAYQCQGANVGEMGTLRQGNGHVTGGVPFVASVALRGRDGGATAELGDDVATALRASQGGGDKPHVLAFTSKDYGGDAGDLAPTLRSLNFDKSHMNGGGQVAVAFQQNTRDEVRYIGGDGQIAGALHTGGTKQQNYIQQPMAVRRLTPTECERLMGLPDSWTAGQADSSRYRQLGNSVAVPCVEWIARRLVALSPAPPAGRQQTLTFPVSAKTEGKEGT